MRLPFGVCEWIPERGTAASLIHARETSGNKKLFWSRDVRPAMPQAPLHQQLAYQPSGNGMSGQAI
jgi:hypothetical protein